MVFGSPTNNTGWNITFFNEGSASGVNTGGPVQITEFLLMREDQEALYDAGEIFNPDYIAMMRRMNPRVVRYLGWNHINNSNRAQHIHDTPNGYISYSVPQWPPSLFVTGAAHDSGTDTYSVSAPSGWAGLVDGATVQFKSPATNLTTAPKLNVGGTGAIVIKTQAQNLNQAINTAGGTDSITLNTSNTFVYNAKIGTWVYSRGGLIASVPLDVQTDLCNKLAVGCWYQFPAFYTDTAVASYVQQILGRLNPSLTTWLEYGNEFGSTGAAFTQTFWAAMMSYAKGMPNSGGIGWHYQLGTRARELFGDVIPPLWPAGRELKRVGMTLIFLSFTTGARVRYGGGDQTYDSNGLFTNGNAGDYTAVGGTGGVSTTTLTISGAPAGGRLIQRGDIVNGVPIQSYGTGAGGTGTYTLGSSLNIANGTTLTFTDGTVSGPGGTVLPLSQGTGSQSGTVLTVTSMTQGTIQVGHFVNGTSQVVSFGTGTGGTGTYNMAGSVTINSGQLIFNTINTGQAIAKDYTQVGDRPIDFMEGTGYANYTRGANVPANSRSMYTTDSLQTSTNVSAMTATNPVNATVASTSGWANGDRLRLTSIGGLTQMSTVWTTVSALSGNTFDLSNCADNNGRYISCDSGSRNSTVTMTIASPGVVTWTGNLIPDNLGVVFTTTGALPTGITAGVTYYARDITADTFRVAATPGGTAINTSGSQSGVHTATTDAYAVYTSGGVAARITPTINDGLINAITDYMSGDPVRIDNALQWYQTDSYSGTRLNNSGVPVVPTIFGTLDATFGSASAGLQTWIAAMATLPSAPAASVFYSYEGGYDSLPFDAQATGRLGLPTTYTQGSIDLLTAWRNSDYARQYTNELAQRWVALLGQESVIAQLCEVCLVLSVPAEWAIFPGNLYTTPYKLFDGIANFNSSGQQNFLLKRDLDPAANDNTPMFLDQAA